MEATELRLGALFSPLKISLDHNEDHNDHVVLGFGFVWCEAQFYIILSQQPRASDSWFWLKLEILYCFPFLDRPKTTSEQKN